MPFHVRIEEILTISTKFRHFPQVEIFPLVEIFSQGRILHYKAPMVEKFDHSTLSEVLLTAPTILCAAVMVRRAIHWRLRLLPRELGFLL